MKMSWRAVAERATHRLVLRRRLPSPYSAARIYVSSEAGLRYLKPSLEAVDPDLLRAVKLLVHDGDVVWDIGANIGLFSFAAALQAGSLGSILAVEADTWNVGLLRRSAFRTKAGAKVQVLPAAASDRVGVASFSIAVRSRSTSYLDAAGGTTQTGGVRETQTVPTVTLDHLLEHFPAPDLVKVDVEGAEALVLAGAGEVLRRRPRILCEVSEENTAAVCALLEPHGYAFYDGERSAYDVPVAKPPYMTVALPS